MLTKEQMLKEADVEREQALRRASAMHEYERERIELAYDARIRAIEQNAK
jgi:hypothetical protein